MRFRNTTGECIRSTPGAGHPWLIPLFAQIIHGTESCSASSAGTAAAKMVRFFAKFRVGRASRIPGGGRRSPPEMEGALRGALGPRPMVYLFASPKEFGDVFVETALAETRRLGLDLTLVRSSRWSWKKGGRSLRARLRHLRRGWSERRLSHRLSGRLLMVRDVNDPAFVGGIAPGAHGIIASFDQILRQPLIGAFASLVNWHPSLLPMYRGPVPAYWCLENGEETTGFSLHEVTPQVDAGPILYQEMVPIAPGHDWTSLNREIAVRAQPAFRRYLASLVGRDELPRRLVDAGAVYRQKVEYGPLPGRLRRTRARQEEVTRDAATPHRPGAASQ